VPGVVISIQTFGNLINFHPYLHCLVTDGCFMPNGWFYVFPEIDVRKLERLFRHKVLKLLLKEKRISREWVQKLLSWRNSGFNIHNRVKIPSEMIGIPFWGLAAGNSKLPSVPPGQLPFRSLKPSKGNRFTRHRAFWGGEYPIR
jgi:hypothetical protein